MELPVSGPLLEAVSLWVLAFGLGYSVVAVLGRDGLRAVTAHLRRRFVLGVPWGTLLVVLGVLGVYFVLQGGGKRGGPVVVAFRSWSYGYPLGMVLAPFAHASEGHVTGNLLSTVAFAPLAEYVWSHYPTGRGDHSFGDWVHNPFARIGLFVAVVFVVGLATSFFIPGALIGFSGVVFAFGGFAIVTRPVAGVFVLLADRVVSLGYRSLLNPVSVASGSQRFVTPYWADIAVQGHALGLFLGMLLGFLVVRNRKAWPGSRRVWFAVLVFTVSKSLFALYWYLSGTRYVLFRAIGLGALFVLAGVAAVAFARADRTLVGRIDLSRREAAVGVLVCVLLAIAVVAVPYNAISVSPGPEADSGIDVRDYSVTYVENVPNRYISSVEIPLVRDSLQVNTSGVIVTSGQRDAWERVVPAQSLALDGRAVFPVGGLGWRELIVANRSGWSVVDGGSTYKVHIRRQGDTPKQVFTDDPANVSAVIANRSMQIRPVDPGYELRVRRNGTTLTTTPIPQEGANITADGLRFNRTGQALYAERNGTRVKIATRKHGG